jgi:hypothetical protein
MRLRTRALAADQRRPGQDARRGSALLMAFLMLVLLFAIVFQLSYSTNADFKVANNDVTVTTMDLAVESALQEVYDRLKTDGESSGDSSSGSGAAGASGAQDPTGGAGAAAAGAAGQGQQTATDSHEDDWAKPQRTTINDIELRVIVQDEDSKLNLLGMLTDDEEEADKQFDRVVRVIDLFRAGSTVDVDHADAIRLAEEIKEYLKQRTRAVLPKPRLLSDSDEDPDRGLPLSFSEFSALEHFDSSLFRDFRDDHGYVVHSLGSYLTVWTSITSRKDQAGTGAGASAAGSGAKSSGSGSSGSNSSNKNGSSSGTSGKSGSSSSTGSTSQTNGSGSSGSGGQQGGSSGGSGGSGGAGGSGTPNFGVMVNINTAPLAVLNSLADDRVVPGRFWDGVLEYRNAEDQEAKAQEDPDQEPVLDEYGNEVVKHQVFDSLEKLNDVDGFDRLDTEAKTIISNMLTTQSQVFSIYVTARKATGQRDEFAGFLGRPRGGELKEDQQGQSLVRTVRSVVWRYKDGDKIRIIPIVRWEVLDYTPFELQDYPNEDR